MKLSKLAANTHVFTVVSKVRNVSQEAENAAAPSPIDAQQNRERIVETGGDKTRRFFRIRNAEANDEVHRWKSCSVAVHRQTLYGISVATSVVARVDIVEGRSTLRLRGLGKQLTCASHDEGLRLIRSTTTWKEMGRITYVVRCTTILQLSLRKSTHGRRKGSRDNSDDGKAIQHQAQV